MSIEDKLNNIDTDEFVAAMIEELKEYGVRFHDHPVDEKDVDPEVKRMIDNAFLFDTSYISRKGDDDTYQMDGIYNARITHTKLGFEDHGCLTFILTLEGGGWGVAYGNYCLGHRCDKPGESKNMDGYGAIIQLLNTLEVDNWEDLKGMYVRASFEHSTIKSIGHLIKDKWFDYKEYYQTVEAIEANGAE